MEDAGAQAADEAAGASLKGSSTTRPASPHEMIVSDIELLRDETSKSFGLQLQSCAGHSGPGSVGCCVKKIMPYVSTDRIEEGDVLVDVNGKDASDWTYERIVQEIRSIGGDSLVLSVRRNLGKNDALQPKAIAVAPATAIATKPKTPKKKKGRKRKAKPLPTNRTASLAAASLEQQSISAQQATTATDAGVVETSVPDSPDHPPMPPLPDATNETEVPMPPLDPPPESPPSIPPPPLPAEADLHTPPESPMPPLPNEDALIAEMSDCAPSPPDMAEKLFPNANVGQENLKLSFTPARIKEGKIIVRITKDGANVGTIVSHLVRFGPMFKEKCEQEHADLELVADALFGEAGKPGCSELDGRIVTMSPMEGEPKKRKRGRPRKSEERCFLYIQEFVIESEYRVDGASDVGSAAIRSFLTHESIIKKWDVAAYMTDYHHYMYPPDDGNNNNGGDGEHSHGEADEDLSAESWAEIETERRRWMCQDARQFIRVGFLELSEQTTHRMGLFYITGERLASNQCRPIPFTHAEALSISLRCDAPPDVEKRNLQMLDDKMRHAILHECDHHMLEMHQRSFQTLFARSQKSQYDDSDFVTTRLVPEIDKCISQGADVTRANALHAAAAAQCIGLFVPLLDRGGDPNSKDQHLMTPLMVAASVAGQKDDVIKSQFVIASLIALGADKNVRDKSGRTAIGHFYRTLRSMNSFASNELGLPESPIDPTIERLLMPAGGMTAADKRAQTN